MTWREAEAGAVMPTSRRHGNAGSHRVEVATTAREFDGLPAQA